MFPGAMVADAGYPQGGAQVEHDQAAAAAPRQDETPRWFVRGSLGAGGVVSSDQRDLLELNGYEETSVRWYYGADAAAMPWSPLGIGGFLGYSTRKVDPEYGGPPLEEQIYRLGVQVPLTVGSETFRFLFVPRLGVVSGRQSLHGRGDFVEGPLFGAEAGIVFPKIHIGFAIGGYSAPVPASGDLGERENFGGAQFLLSVYFDG
jgi:hypothetical protein